ncbi:MAG: AmmeMemoRadiSam system radical SAM enzyme [Planctomycetes bacterium]|nr:AmmeMemoRadiSam system radical SAM enzyme [Planctomycetota bacterium]
MEIDRRGFLRTVAAAGCTLPTLGHMACAAGDEDESRFVREARHYEKLDEKRVRCVLCPRQCEVADRERGYCGVRENRDGTYYTLVHGRACSLAIDPIEKKPLFHFLPGTAALSIATAGCNIQCKFCQNWDISQKRPEQVPARYLPPDLLARLAREREAPSIAYTYSEPVIFYEYMYDCAAAGRKLGVRSVMISNGYIKKDPLRELTKVLHAVKIDLKAFTETFYKETCKGELAPVLETLKELKAAGIWFEIVVLIIPTLNDGKDEIRAMCAWVAKELGPHVPIHFTRFHPTYMLRTIESTPVETLEMARDAARAAGLAYAYIGNVVGHEGENTYCHACKKRVIRRYGFYIREIAIEDGKCAHCGAAIPGVWS